MAQETGQVSESLGVAHADHTPAEGDRPVVPLAPEPHRGSGAACSGACPAEVARSCHESRDCRQPVTAAIDETDPRACHQVRHGPRDQHFARSGAGEDLSGHVHGHSAQLATVRLALAGVKAGPGL